MEDENARFIWRVYRWMSLGLGLTGLTAMMVASSPQALSLVFGNRFVFYALLLAELAMVWTFSTIARKASVTVAMALFLTYAITNGVTMAVVFLIYTARSIADVFLICTGMFAAMSFYGSVTKKDLTSVGSFSIMGLFGIILAGIVNLFVRSDMMSFVIACLGVVVFVGLTAYDTQKIKAMNVIGNEGTDDDTKEALNGALVLYLDFINLFLMLLRLLGKRR
ncbi:MAG: Bax inhibitor-1/YccA family protein [Deltaproteobacteria bacterium]|nr:Bax inhibitor-1/YccA family protein [Deltaproteobacteria bacterium]